jgi:hypothetical protein
MTSAAQKSALVEGLVGKPILNTTPAVGVERGSPLTKSAFATLADAFDRDGVCCCYWKSARRLSDIFEGRSDLDLLVARPDRQRATKILIECGFKHAPDAPGRDDPAIMSFLGYDEASGVILHAHLHFRLVIGTSLFKNFRLPCESSFLARSRLSRAFNLRVLAPADEALLLFIRAHVEINAFDPVQLSRKQAIAQKFRNDFAALAPGLEPEAVRQSASEIFSAELAAEVARALATSDPTLRRAEIAARIKGELSAYRTCNSAESAFRMAARMAMFLFGASNRRSFHLPRSWGRRAPGGGVIIAFVGVDGSGKSTAAAMVRTWLGAEMDVLSAYFGTGDGQTSSLLRPFKALAQIAARLVKTKPRGASHGRISDRPPGPVYSLLFSIWALAVAADKRHKLILAYRAARRGFVVVADRYPQNEIRGFNDGPLLHRLRWAPDWLKRFESAIYMRAHRAPPDLVVKLHVGPDTVARREPEMSPALIGERIAGLAELKFPGSRIVSIDARCPLDEVKRLIKREVWNVL